MPIDPTLRNSLLTAGAHAHAIARALDQLAAGVTIHARVTGIRTPTLTHSGGGEDPGCCFAGPVPPPPPVLDFHEFTDVVQDAARLFHYLQEVVAPHM